MSSTASPAAMASGASSSPTSTRKGTSGPSSTRSRVTLLALWGVTATRVTWSIGTCEKRRMESTAPSHAMQPTGSSRRRSAFRA